MLETMQVLPYFPELGMHTTASAMPPTSHFFNIVFVSENVNFERKKKRNVHKLSLNGEDPARRNTDLISNAFVDLHVFLLEQFEKTVVSP
jgi:hypothetical protein